MKPTTVTIVADRYWPSRGGVEQAALALSEVLPAEWNVRIITHRPSTRHTLYSTYAGHGTIPACDPNKRPITPLEPGWRRRLLLLPLLLWNAPLIRKKTPKYLYDLLYRWYKAAFFTSLEAELADTDLVHCISTSYLSRCVTDVCLKNGIRFIHQPFIHFKRWGDSQAQLQTYAAADAILCPTESFRQKLLEQIDPGYRINSTVIPPIILERQYPKLQYPPVPGRFILFLGRREAHKGLTELLVAFTGLEDSASLVIAGPGEQIHSRNMMIFDLGEVDDPIKMWLLASCDIFCLPSTDESFGIVFAEAMSAGKPIVAIDVPPINHIVKNGVNGILVPQDDTERLHDALEHLLNDKQMRIKMGEKSRERFDRLFSSTIVIKKIHALYESLGVSPPPVPEYIPQHAEPVLADTTA